MEKNKETTMEEKVKLKTNGGKEHLFEALVLWLPLEACLSTYLNLKIYVNDIFFGSTNDSLWKEFSQDMKNEFEIVHDGWVKFLPWTTNKANKEWNIY